MTSTEPIEIMQQNEHMYLTTSKFDSCDQLVKSVREFITQKDMGYLFVVQNKTSM